MKIIKSLIVLSLLLLPVGGVQAQLLDKKILTLEAAEKVAAAAEAEAKKRNATVVIVVVDDGGYPLVLKRLNDTQVWGHGVRTDHHAAPVPHAGGRYYGRERPGPGLDLHHPSASKARCGAEPRGQADGPASLRRHLCVPHTAV